MQRQVRHWSGDIFMDSLWNKHLRKNTCAPHCFELESSRSFSLYRRYISAFYSLMVKLIDQQSSWLTAKSSQMQVDRRFNQEITISWVYLLILLSLYKLQLSITRFRPRLSLKCVVLCYKLYFLFQNHLKTLLHNQCPMNFKHILLT